MRSTGFQKSFAPLLLCTLAACGGSQHALPANPEPAGSPGTFTVDGYPAKFTEYALPAGVNPADVTVGPDGAIWFANFRGFFASTIAAGEITGTGAVRLIQQQVVPQTDRLLTAGSAGIGTTGARVYTLADDPDYIREVFLTSMTPGSDTVTRAADTGFQCCAEVTQKFATDKRGTMWFLSCPDSCGAFSGILLSITSSGSGGPSTFIGNPGEVYLPNGIGFGADGDVYVTTVYDNGFAVNGFEPLQGVVFKLSPRAEVLARYALPVGSDPQGIAGGPDGNLWIAERGTGKIARMTADGQVTEFALLDPHSQPFQIIAANDGALWFTEQGSGALGRIATDGAITEYPLPSRGQPFGIVSCPSACENAHGRIWFSEQAGGKIGKLEF